SFPAFRLVCSSNQVSADFDSGSRPEDGRGRRPFYGTRLVDVPRHNRRAEQVTGAQSDSPDGSVRVEEPKRYARIVSPSMVKWEDTLNGSFHPKYHGLPRHVFQAHTNRPAIAPIDEIRELPTHGVHCTGAYLHTRPAALGIEHRAVPSITKPRGDGADLANFYGPLAEEKNGARLPLSNVGPRPGPLEAENEAVPLILAPELTATD